MSHRISVVVPLYNKAAYVAEAVRSACEQRCPPLEVIVVNDGSTDGSAEVVRGLPYANIRVIDIPNSGVSVARNTGIEAARGDYIAFLDADDWWSPYYLCAIVRLIDLYPECSMYGTAFIQRLSSQILPVIEPDVINTTEAELIDNYFRERKKRLLFFTSSFCVPRRLLMEEGIRYSIGEPLGEDLDFFFQLAERGPVAYLELPLSAYRQEVAQSLTQTYSRGEMLPAFERLLARTYADMYPPHLRKSARRLVHHHGVSYARNLLVMQGDAKGALIALMFSVYRPGLSIYWWSTLIGCLIPKSIRGHFLAPGKGWKDNRMFSRLRNNKTPNYAKE